MDEWDICILGHRVVNVLTAQEHGGLEWWLRWTFFRMGRLL